MKDKYSVVVGNLGTVWSGRFRDCADKVFADYVAISNCEFGRASGEDVALFVDGDIEREHTGWLSTGGYKP